MFTKSKKVIGINEVKCSICGVIDQGHKHLSVNEYQQVTDEESLLLCNQGPDKNHWETPPLSNLQLFPMGDRSKRRKEGGR